MFYISFWFSNVYNVQLCLGNIDTSSAKFIYSSWLTFLYAHSYLWAILQFKHLIEAVRNHFVQLPFTMFTIRLFGFCTFCTSSGLYTEDYGTTTGIHAFKETLRDLGRDKVNVL